MQVFFSPGWLPGHVSGYLEQILITLCLLYILMRIPFWIARPVLSPFGRSPLRRAARFAFTAAVLSRVAPVLRPSPPPGSRPAAAGAARAARPAASRKEARRELRRHRPRADPLRRRAPDKVLAGLTARQVAIAAAAAVIIWAGFQAARHVMPLPAFAALAAPVGLAAVALVIGERDGLPLDRLLAAAWRQARSPRRLVTAPEGIPAPPAWAAPPGPQPRPRRRWRRCGGTSPPDGVIGLGSAGAATVAAVSTVNFALRSPAEQDALAAAYGRWLARSH